ncbi:MAG: Guanylate kinase [Firmicutes bacterium ADurb.Bin182]|nr:MAG: Guanylate kinase [Firmicutes bacterium ADurb.Bin182]
MEKNVQEVKKGLLIIISGPAGVGKGVVCKGLIERNSNIKMSVSATTRQKRPREVEGISYFFKTPEEFSRMIESGEFLEYMYVFDSNYYGTPKAYVEEELESGTDIILEIDVNGAMRVKQIYPDAISIFIAPPDLGTLKSRLIGRGTETPEALERRFGAALSEISRIGEYDYIVINDVVDKAVGKIESILSAERSSVKRNKPLIDKLQKGCNQQ